MGRNFLFLRLSPSRVSRQHDASVGMILSIANRVVGTPARAGFSPRGHQGIDRCPITVSALA